MAPTHIGRAPRLEAARHAHRVAVVFNRTQQQRKFVTAQACHQVLDSRVLTQPLSHLAQEQVTDVVAQAVIDEFEAVKVQVEHRATALRVVR